MTLTDWPILLSIFVLGTIIGSFLNVVILRHNTGLGLGGRSHCFACGHQLAPWELLPILSFVYQRGACRHCRSRISRQYPLVELTSGLIFALIWFFFPPQTPVRALVMLIYWVASSLLLVMAVYDIRQKIIPDGFVYSFDILAFLSLFVGSSAWWHTPYYPTLLAGPMLALPFALLWLVSKGTWMGLGDAKLVLGLGWLLGLNAGINAVILAFWLGALIGLSWMFLSFGRFKARLEIPFGPFLIAGFFLMFFSSWRVFDIHTLVQLFRL